MSSGKKLSTHCIHAGRLPDAYGAVHSPIYNTTTFAFDSTADLQAAATATNELGFYTRYGSNPTIIALERQLAGLEGAESALVFSAGMAAISTTCLALGRGGIVCVGNAYGGTLTLLADYLPQLGISTQLLLSDEINRLETILAGACSLVIIETPCNPDLKVQDIQSLADLAHAHGARLVVDNTFATPVNQQPLAQGADLVVHSATKYLGGHSDLTAGAAMGPREIIVKLNGWRCQLGQTPAPETAALLGRSLTTLVARVERQNTSAAQIAAVMEGHPGVRRVFYPGLASAPDHPLARQQMTGFGGMLALELAGPAHTATVMVDSLQLFLNAPSLGGIESLVTQPALTSHGGLDREERERRGIGDSLVRLSIGLEDPDDLLADLCQALDTAIKG